MISRFYLILFALFPLISCSQNKNQDDKVQIEDLNIKPSFSSLQFESEGKPCLAAINNRYIDFKEKSEFALSLFISVKTLGKDKNGHPSTEEAQIFNKLQTDLLQKLNTGLGNYCYVGTTTITGYRDILLYIKPKHQEIATEILQEIKKEENRVESISFESDPKWEAVSGFYEALKLND